MTVTIFAENNFINICEKYEGVDYDIVSTKEIHKRNGCVVNEVRIKRGKRDIVLSSGEFQTITIQDEETGKYLFKYNR